MTAGPLAARYARARAAQAVWAERPVEDRARRLLPLARLLADRQSAIADLIREENGKPRTEAVFHDVVGSVALVRYACRAAPRCLAPREVPLPWTPHRQATVYRRPYGLVLAIGPWNFPLAIPVSLVVPALLAGNAVVLKPSERAPRAGALLGELLGELDLYPDLFQVVQGDGAVGGALVEAGPDKVLFTGSVEVGRKVMAAAARFPIPVSLELGGVDALIARTDADLEATASAAVWGATFNGGQACCSVERLLVHRSIYEPLLARVADKLERLSAERDLAPAIDARQGEVWAAHLDDAARRGLRFRAGGRMLDARRAQPTLVDGAGARESKAWRDETFGPLVAALPFDSDEEARALHDATPYGLTASVFSRDLAAAEALARRLKAGAVAVNEVAAMVYGSPELPWGGVGHSGFGRSHGEEGLLDTTWAQVVELPRGPAFGPKRPWYQPYDAEQARLLGRVGAAIASDGLARARALAGLPDAIARLLARAPRL